jgi:hypothetical protein
MFTKNIAPIAGTIVYIALVLTAMQVGLDITKLVNNDAFQNTSYGFIIFSILSPIILTVVVMSVLTIFILYNFIVAFVINKKSQGGRRTKS